MAPLGTTLVGISERLFALMALILASPLMLLIAIAIRLDSPGGAIFKQRRIARIPSGGTLGEGAVRMDAGRPSGERNGRHGSSTNGIPPSLAVPAFTIYKFRTYHANSDRLAPQRARFEFEPEKIDQVHLQLQNDPRITRVGRFLRRTSLDELPNFLNVLLGHMRIVGPRPEVVPMYGYYTDAQKIKFSVKPGITGLAQVNGRGKLNFEQTVAYDLKYVRERSWRLDLMILLRTLKVVLTQDGSY